MSKLKAVMDKVLSAICAIMFSLMTILAVYQVGTRYVFKNPSSWSEELLTYSFAWLGMLAATLVFGERDHMRLSYFADKVKGKNATVLAIVSEVVILIFTVLVLIWGGISIVNLTMTQVTAALAIPMGYVYSVMPISGILIAIYCVINIANLAAQLKTR